MASTSFQVTNGINVRFGANLASINQYLAAKIPAVARDAPITAATTASKINGNRIEILLAPTERMIEVSRRLAKAATRTVFTTSKTVTNSIENAMARAKDCRPLRIWKNLSNNFR